MPLGAVWLSWPHSCSSLWLENRWLGTSRRLCCRKSYKLWLPALGVCFMLAYLFHICIFRRSKCSNFQIQENTYCVCVTDFSETGGAAGKGGVIQKVHTVDGSRTMICRTSASLDSSMSIWRWVRFYSYTCWTYLVLIYQNISELLLNGMKDNLFL